MKLRVPIAVHKVGVFYSYRFTFLKDLNLMMLEY